MKYGKQGENVVRKSKRAKTDIKKGIYLEDHLLLLLLFVVCMIPLMLISRKATEFGG